MSLFFFRCFLQNIAINDYFCAKIGQNAMIGTPEIILIAIVVLLLFGGKKIPELMQGLGRGVKSFKDGMNGLDVEKDEKSEAKTEVKSEK